MSKANPRRQLREVLIQFLYSAGVEGLQADENDAMDLILESQREKIYLSRCKAVLHLQQGRSNMLPAIEELVRQTVRIDDPESTDDSLSAIRDIFKSETALQTTLESLRLEVKGNKNILRLRELIADCLKHNQASRASHARLTTPRPSLPAIESTRTMALELCAQLPKYSTRFQDTLSDDPPAEVPELSSLRKAIANAQEHRDEILSLIKGIRTHSVEIDKAIESVVENYSAKRIDQVDHAIIRLGTYELLFSPDVPVAVAINEAIEIARKYSSTESPRFINGVLDQIKQLRTPTESTGNL